MVGASKGLQTITPSVESVDRRTERIDHTAGPRHGTFPSQWMNLPSEICYRKGSFLYDSFRERDTWRLEQGETWAG